LLIFVKKCTLPGTQWAHSGNFSANLGLLAPLLLVRAFSVAGPVCWNSLPDYLESSHLSFNCFSQQLKTFLFSRHCWCALRMHDTYLLTFVWDPYFRTRFWQCFV